MDHRTRSESTVYLPDANGGNCNNFSRTYGSEDVIVYDRFDQPVHQSSLLVRWIHAACKPPQHSLNVPKPILPQERIVCGLRKVRYVVEESPYTIDSGWHAEDRRFGVMIDLSYATRDRGIMDKGYSSERHSYHVQKEYSGQVEVNTDVDNYLYRNPGYSPVDVHNACMLSASTLPV